MAKLEDYYEGGPKTWNEAFPPICLKSHWDPTLVSERILPKFQHTMTYDPRPSTKVCVSYHTTGENGQLSIGSTSTPLSEFPPGGSAGRGFPFSQFDGSAESELFRMNKPLSRCAERKFVPPNSSPMPSTQSVDGTSDSSSPYSEIQFPGTCRRIDDEAAWKRSSRPFFNPTRYDRTQMVPSGLPIAESNMPPT